MTTVKDYARDLVLETQKKLQEHLANEFIKSKKLSEIDPNLSNHDVDDLVDDFMKTITERIMGVEL